MFHISFSKTFLHQNVEIFQKSIKVKGTLGMLSTLGTLGTFLGFAYFSSYLQTKETAWKRGDAIYSKPVMLSSSLGQFWKVLIKVEQVKSLMVVSLTPKN